MSILHSALMFVQVAGAQVPTDPPSTPSGQIVPAVSFDGRRSMKGPIVFDPIRNLVIDTFGVRRFHLATGEVEVVGEDEVYNGGLIAATPGGEIYVVFLRAFGEPDRLAFHRFGQREPFAVRPVEPAPGATSEIVFLNLVPEHGLLLARTAVELFVFGAETGELQASFDARAILPDEKADSSGRHAGGGMIASKDAGSVYAGFGDHLIIEWAFGTDSTPRLFPVTDPDALGPRVWDRKPRNPGHGLAYEYQQNLSHWRRQRFLELELSDDDKRIRTRDVELDLATGVYARREAGDGGLLSPDGRYRIYQYPDPGAYYRSERQVELSVREANSGRLVYDQAGARFLGLSSDGRFFVSQPLDSSFELREFPTGKLIVNSWYFRDETPSRSHGYTSGNYVWSTPDGYYLASYGGRQNARLLFRGGQYTLDVFDVHFNRPAIVLERIGASSDWILESLRTSRNLRLQRMGVTGELSLNLPVIRMEGDELPAKVFEPDLKLTVSGSDPAHALRQFHVTINGVPIPGGEQAVDPPAHEARAEFELELGRGSNEIIVRAENELGVLSLPTLASVEYEAFERGGGIRVLAVGVSEYQDAENNLTYAAKDAQDLVASLEACAENIRRRFDSLVLVDAEVTRENVLRAREFLEGSQIDDMLLVFFAGHGLLDDDLAYWFGTHDIDVEHPGERGLSYQAIEGLLVRVPARRKLILLDTCHSGEISESEAAALRGRLGQDVVVTARARGLRAKARVGERTRRLAALAREYFPDLESVSGADVLSSAAGAEFAFEAEAVQNGVFTHALLETIRACQREGINGGNLPVSELLSRSAARVVELTSGAQTPTLRQGNLAQDFLLLRRAPVMSVVGTETMTASIERPGSDTLEAIRGFEDQLMEQLRRYLGRTNEDQLQNLTRHWSSIRLPYEVTLIACDARDPSIEYSFGAAIGKYKWWARIRDGKEFVLKGETTRVSRGLSTRPLDIVLPVVYADRPEIEDTLRPVLRARLLAFLEVLKMDERPIDLASIRVEFALPVYGE